MSREGIEAQARARIIKSQKAAAREARGEAPPTCAEPAPAIVEHPEMRRRAIYCALKYGLLPSRLYERDRHYDCSYWAHLRLNVAYAWSWIRRRNTIDDVAFELETNW